MLKKLTLSPLCLILGACSTFTKYSVIDDKVSMPSYEFYEAFSETDNANIVLPKLEKNLITVTAEDLPKERPLFIPEKDDKTFRYSKRLTQYYNNDGHNFVLYHMENMNGVKSKINFISLDYLGGFSFNKEEFYALYNLSPAKVKIEQLKKSCLYNDSYKDTIYPMFKLTLNNGKNLYLINRVGGNGSPVTTDLLIFRKLPDCKIVGMKNVNEYGEPNFEW